MLFQKNIDCVILVRRFVRFAVVGVLSTLLHFFVAMAILSALVYPVVCANAIAFFCATIVSFFLNTVWSFSRRIGRDLFVRYCFVAILGLALSSLVSFSLFVIGVSNYANLICAVLIVPVLNFVLHNFWTYKK